MIKEADFLRPISHGKSAFLLLHYGFTVDVYRNSIDYQQIIFKKQYHLRLSTKTWISVRKTPLITF